MAKLFLSYSRKDLDLIAPLAKLLENAGHEVWWDRRISGGAQFSAEIAAALADADVVIVAWSAESLGSNWVRDEAAEGRDRGRLVPILLDSVAQPLGFRQYQAIDFSDWDGAGRPDALEELLYAIDSAVSAERPRRRAPPVRRKRRRARPWAWALAGAAAVIVLLIAVADFTLDRPFEVPANVGASPVTAAAPAETTAPAATVDTAAGVPPRSAATASGTPTRFQPAGCEFAARFPDAPSRANIGYAGLDRFGVTYESQCEILPADGVSPAQRAPWVRERVRMQMLQNGYSLGRVAPLDPSGTAFVYDGQAPGRATSGVVIIGPSSWMWVAVESAAGEAMNPEMQAFLQSPLPTS